MAKIRVLLLLHGLTLNGAPKVALDAFEAMSNDVEVMTISLDGGPREERCRQMGPLHLFSGYPAGESLTARFRRRSERRLWARRIEEFRPELVYVNSVASLPLLRQLDIPAGIPILLHVHELRSYLLKFLKSEPAGLVERPNHYIVVSEAVRQALTNDCGVNPEKTTQIPAFIREQDAVSAPLSPRREGPFVVGGAGFPVWIKGSVLWVQMAAEVLRIMGPERVRFVYVGVAEEENSWQMQEMARKLGVFPHIEFVPTTPDALSHFAGYDVFVSSSWEDPCPITVIENMMLQKPVVCFAGSGGAPYEIGETGVVVEGFSPRAMAEAIADLAADPARRTALGVAARQRALENFTDTAQVPRIRELIGRLARPGAAVVSAPDTLRGGPPASVTR